MCIMDWSSALCSSDLETIFDPQLEPVGDAEGEGERRVVFPRLDRVDRLARHFEPLGEIALAPVALGAQDLEAISHDPRTRSQICANPSPIAPPGTARSEERRVGKECVRTDKSRRMQHDNKKKKENTKK